jgi:Rrf2 family protein
MFSQTTEYAVRAVVMLAYHHGHPPVGAAWLARQARVPASYLAKLLQKLVRAGLVVSTRGARGGFHLARPPQDISLLDVVQAVEPLERIRQCPLGLASHCHQLCPMHARLDEAMARVEQILSSSSVAELIAEPSRPRPMLETPAGQSGP